MNTDHSAKVMAISFLLGAGFMGLLMGNVGTFATFKAEKLRDACELNIPRSQQCVMQFVPESKRSFLITKLSF